MSPNPAAISKCIKLYMQTNNYSPILLIVYIKYGKDRREAIMTEIVVAHAAPVA